jgi:hypothetical protein
VTRRHILKTAGRVAAVVAGEGIWRAWDQGVFSAGKGPAYEPWHTWRTDDTPPALSLVRAAILAANPHNSQPWLFHVMEHRIDLYADPSRHLGAIDPLRREMAVAVGCALENLVLAAATRRIPATVTLAPDGHPANLARVELGPAGSGERPDAATTARYEAIPQRHTHRGPYESRAVDTGILAHLTALASDGTRVIWFTAAGERARVGQAIVRATEAVIADREQSEVTERWLRFRWEDVQRFRDGLTIDATVFPAALRIPAKLLPAVSREQGDGFWLSATRTTTTACAGFGMVCVDDLRDPRARLAGGRVWQRVHLAATTYGLAMQPMSQLTERADRETELRLPPAFGMELRELVGDDRSAPLLVFRFGHAPTSAAASPRRPVSAVLIG